MIFDSYTYFIFLFAILLLYRKLTLRYQNILLLAGSYVFYGAWSINFLSLILLSTLTDFFIAKGISETSCKKNKKRLLYLSIITNLGLLAFFKYCNFFVASFIDTASLFGWHPDPFYLNIILPVGISFYTFQTLGYTIDVYREEIKPCKSIIDFALFVSFFPQLIAGPIERAAHLLPQLQTARTKNIDWAGACWLVLLGLVKKLVIANQLAPITDAVFNHPGSLGFWETLIGFYAFTFQIYCDFSGYTDIARGSAKLLGINLSFNFKQPYLAKNPQDFWRRWHISLSQWLRDYLYIPLGGSRYRPLRNLMITMLLGGLWHGAAWHFVIWGAYHGALLVLHRIGKPVWLFFSNCFSPKLWSIVCVVTMFHLTVLGWVIFRAESFNDIVLLLSNLGNITPLVAPVAKQIVIAAFLTLPVWLHHYLKEKYQFDSILRIHPLLTMNAICYLVLMLCFWIVHHDVPFIYFQF